MLAGGSALLATCSASTPPAPQPGSVTVNVSQTAVGINVCTSACVQNVNVQNISVVNVNQAGARPAPTTRPAPTRPAVKLPPATSSPMPAPPIPQRVAYLPPPVAPQPPPVPVFGDPGRPLIGTDQTPVVTLATRSTAVLTREQGPGPAASRGPDSGAPVIQLAILGALLVAWISLLLSRRSTPATGLLTLDDGSAA